jgi:hypothetical protein
MNYGESDGRALLDRMTAAEDAAQHTLDDSTVELFLQLVVGRFVTESPGMKGRGMKCDVERTANGWRVDITK